MKRKSWKAVATALYEAVAECDWSLGKVQEERVQGAIDAAQNAYDERLKARKNRKKVRQ